jgi:hypothetical protein
VLPDVEGQSQRNPALLTAGAAAVLILSMFLDWYKLDLPERIGGREIDVPTFNAFEGLERADVALVVAAALAIIVAGVVLAGVLANSPGPGIALVLVSLFALAVLIYRGTSRPARLLFGGPVDTTLMFGWFVGLAAALLMVIGALLVYRAGPRLQLEPAEVDEEQGPGTEPTSAEAARARDE